MKFSKILMGAAVLVAAISFSACKLEEDEEGLISGNKISGTHDGTSGKYLRGFATTNTNHYAGTAVINIEDAKTIANSSNNCKGVVGFAFGLEETTDNLEENLKTKAKEADIKTYKFGIVGVRWNAKSSNAEYYVEWVENAPSSVFGYSDSSDFHTTDFGMVNYIDPKTASVTTLSDVSLGSDNSLTVAVKVLANEDGSYTVGLYKSAEDAAADVTTDTSNTNNSTSKSTPAVTSGKALKVISIPAATTGYSSKAQHKIGRYASIYSGETLNATVKYEDLEGNVIPVEYDTVYGF